MPNSARSFKVKTKPSQEQMERKKVELNPLEKAVKFRQGLESKKPEGKVFQTERKDKYTVTNIPKAMPIVQKTASVSVKPVAPKVAPAKPSQPKPQPKEREYVKNKFGQTVLKYKQ